MPDDRSCFTCTHYRDGTCVMADGNLIPEQVLQVGCELRADDVGTPFG